jgi:hypothetical protein
MLLSVRSSDTQSVDAEKEKKKKETKFLLNNDSVVI